MPHGSAPRARCPARPLVLILLLLTAGCSRYDPPPPHVALGTLPVSGSLADARFAGLTGCTSDATSMRCRRNDVRLMGHGPFNAAVDMTSSDGRNGFDQLTLWDDRDQDAVLAIGNALEAAGWSSCFTGTDDRGDQTIYTRPRAPVKFSMDISYWGKRRFRIMPAWIHREPGCRPTSKQEKR